MTTNGSRDHYQGLLIPDERVTLWKEESSNLDLTAGQVVGQPVEATGQSSNLALRVLRKARTGTHADLTVTTQAAGMPALTANAVGQSASFVWSPDGGTTVYGWDDPTVPTGYRSLIVCDGTGTFKHARHPHACVSAANTCLAVYEVELASVCLIRLRRKVQGSSDWGGGVTIVTGLDVNTESHPCLVTLPSGRIVLYFWKKGVRFEASGPYDVPVVYISSVYSDDDGVTWTALSDSATGTVFDTATSATHYAPGQLRAAASPNGQVVLFAGLSCPTNTHANEVIFQFGSADHGISFDLVASNPDVANGDVSLPDVLFDGDVFVVAWFSDTGIVPLSPQVARLGSAFQSWLNADQVSVFDFTGWANSMALGRDESGTLYVWGVRSSVTSFNVRGVCFASYDRGRSWRETLTRADGYDGWFGDGDGAAYGTRPDALSAVSHEGRFILAHGRHAVGASGLSVEESISVAYLGGYTTLTAPVGGPRGWNGNQSGYIGTWLPYDLPEDVGWAKAGSRTTIELGSNGSLHHAQTGGSTLCSYTWNLPETATTDGAFGYFSAVTTAAATNKDVFGGVPVECFVRLSNGSSHTYGFRIGIEADHIWFHKLASATTVNTLLFSGASISPPTNAAGDLVPVIVRWVLTDGANCKAWWRYDDDSALHVWNELFEATMTDIWATATTSTLVMATTLTGGGDASLYGCAWNNLAGDRSENLFLQDATTLNGRPFSVTGTYITDSVTLTAQGGPTFVDEEWTVGADYDFDASRLLLPNPRTGWQAVDTSADIKLAFRISEDGNEIQPTDVLGLAFLRTNIGRVKVEYFEATSAVWTAPVTVDLTYGDLRWQRKNASVYPLTGSYSGKPQPLIREGEFDGAQVVLATGKTRAIRRTKGGRWQAATTSKPTLYIAGTDGTEGNSGTTGRIVARDAVLLISTRSSLYSAVRITIPSPATDASQYAPAEGYWRAGSVLVGSVYLFGDDTDWGRKVETTSRREVISYDDGTSVSRILGPPARIVTVAWTDGVDTSAGSEDTDDPAYHTLDTSGQPLALSNSTPWDAQGIYTRLSTLAHDQLIYLPRIVPFDSTPTPQVINRRHNLVYGRIENDSLNLDTVQGEEGVDEVIRVGVVTIGELT